MSASFRAYRLLAAGLLVAAALTQSASAAFIVPNSSTPPFQNWTRLDADSTYAEWNVFTSGHTTANAPDVGSFGPVGAGVVQTNTTAFLTGGGNIYSFAAPTDFDVTLPNYGHGAGYQTRVVAQIATLGTPLLQSSLALSFNDGNGVQQAPLTSATFVSAPNPSGGTTDEWTVVWDVPNYNASSYLLEFNASGSSMSLDRLAFDAITKAVPEPATLALAAACCGLAPLVRRRKRSS